MNRIEIIMDQTVEELFIERLNLECKGTNYTMVQNALGIGESGPRMGTSVWPETNSIFLIYTDEEGTVILRGLLGRMRRANPNNGIAAFLIPETEEFLF